MVVKPDVSEIDSDNEDNLINNTCEQKPKLDIIDQYKFSDINEKILINEGGDKMSDNEYFLLKRNKKKKILKKEMIYDSEGDKKAEINENVKENNEDNENNENNNDNNNNNENNNNIQSDDDIVEDPSLKEKNEENENQINSGEINEEIDENINSTKKEIISGSENKNPASSTEIIENLLK